MKKLKQKILTGFFFASTLTINAQTFSSFNPPPSNITKCSVPPSNMINSILASVPLCSGQTINDYYTNAKDTIYINLNFWVAKPTSGIGVYDNITYNDALNHIVALNTIMDSLYAPHLVIYPTPIYIKKSKIRFILKNFAFVTNNNIYSNLVLNQYGYINTDKQAINCIWGTHPTVNNIIEASQPIPSTEIKFIMPPTIFGQGLGDSGVLAHEIGHCLGLGHTGPYSGYNPTGTPPSTAFPYDYWYEDSLIWGVAAPCSTLPTNSSNNIMSYSYCRHYLSPQQLAIMHYNLVESPLGATIYNSPCNNTDSLQNIIINNDTNWYNPVYPKGNIIVKAGKSLTINCLVFMREHSKIIVEPSAKLTVSGGTIQSACFRFWEGIEVWGNASLSQIIGSNNMSTNQGMIVLQVNAKIKDAIVGITNCKKILGGVDLTTTGGIIQSTSSTFQNNQIAIDMYPYASYKKGYRKSELSFIKSTTFDINVNYKGQGVTQAPYAFIRTEDVYGLPILGCYFAGDDNMIGIYGLNSRLVVKDYCAFPISPTNCGSGTPIQNNFNLLGKSIYLQNTTSTNFSTIDHALFTNNDLKSNAEVYVNHVNNVEIINNEFYVDGGNALPAPNYGIYLNNCTGYKVENNLFQGSYTGKNAGIYVNNSGPNPNSIYNNTFNTLKQGLWALNQNFDPFTGNGLVMNCNDFILSNTYNIGIQKTNKSLASAPNNTGVNTTQGFYLSTNDQTSVRNKYYTTACNANAENKYYIGTGNSFAISSHGSFLGSQFHPTPQTSNSCSNASEIVDIVGTSGPASPTKSTYCPVNYLSSFGFRALTDALTTNRGNKTAISNSLTATTDGGNTQTLLNAIIGNTSPGKLKNQLLAPAFLSDTVLKKYFLKPNVPNGHLKEVFEKNAPVTQPVWQIVQNLNLPNGIFNQVHTAQNQNKLSSRNALQAQVQLAQREIGLLNNEKIRRFIMDTSGVQVDSILAIYDLKELPNSAFDAVNFLISTGRFADAIAAIADLNAKSPANNNFCRLAQYALALAQTPKIVEQWQYDPAIKDFIISQANEVDYKTQGLAEALIAKVWAIKTIEERLEPIVPNTGGRLGNINSSNEASAEQIELATGISVYPNPANDLLTVKLDVELTEAITIKIVDVTGKVLIEQTCNNTCSIKLNTLQNGIYFVNLFNNTILISTKKIVVIK